LLHALIWAHDRTIGALATYMIAYRKAKVAEDLHRYLSRLSDAELAGRGLNRRQLPQFIRQRLL
jgi:hypothetical protein